MNKELQKAIMIRPKLKNKSLKGRSESNKKQITSKGIFVLRYYATFNFWKTQNMFELN